MSFSPALRFDFSIFKRTNNLSYRPFDLVQDKLQPVSIFVLASPAKQNLDSGLRRKDGKESTSRRRTRPRQPWSR